jgi:hypothetical protein
MDADRPRADAELEGRRWRPVECPLGPEGRRLAVGIGDDQGHKGGSLSRRQRNLEPRASLGQAKRERQTAREALGRAVVLLRGPEPLDRAERAPLDESRVGPPRPHHELAP